MKKSYDIFIAYHLGKNGPTDEASSYNDALDVKNILDELGYRCFLREPFDSTESYQDTRDVARSSKLFLLVLNKHIKEKCEPHKQGNGKTINILSHNCYVYEEIQGFLNQFGGRTSGEAKGRIQTYCKDDSLFDYEIGDLNQVFAQMIPLRDKKSVCVWATDMIEKTKSDDRKTESIDGIEWNSDMANVWKSIYPPSRPSQSEIECYRYYFKKVKNNAEVYKPKVLILGSTKEIRMLSAEMGFITTVVDYNENYYQEVSKELPIDIVKQEELVVSNWSDMLMHTKLRNKRFDIIISDLAIGNIKPEKLEVTLENITRLLRKGGYLLGKNLYSFSRDIINRDVIKNMLYNYLRDTDSTCESAYADTMYNLSIFATQESESRKINFDNIYTMVYQICHELNKTDSCLYEVYCGDKTSFKKKMELSFYTYPLFEVVKIIQKELYFIDTSYGKDSYSKKFPLMVFTKRDDNFDATIQRYNCFKKIKNFVAEVIKQESTTDWSKYISAQYFLVRLTELFVDMKNSNWKSILASIKNSIKENIEVGISEELVCFLDEYRDEKIEHETLYLKNIRNIPDDKNELIGKTYILAVLIYLTSSLTKQYKDINSVFHLVREALFELPDRGDIWQPREAPWIRAKICLSVKNIYNELSQKQKNLIDDTINWIITNYNVYHGDWTCSVGSHVDNRALCCEVLITYYPFIADKRDKQSIMHLVGNILTSYVFDGRIYETYAIYPIGESVIRSIMNDELLRGEPYSKKLTCRIEFLTVLLRMLYFVSEYKEDFQKIYTDPIDYSKEEKFLTRVLVDFWDLFEENYERIRNHLSESEISSIPQVICSLAEAFKD